MPTSPELNQIIDEVSELEGPALPLLHRVQQRFGYIPSETEPLIARALNLSAAEVRGIISFYQDFRSTAPGKHQVKVCCAEACQARGARPLSDHAESRLNISYGDTTADGQVTLDKVYCLGNCACGPSVAIGSQIYGNVDRALFDQIIAALSSGEGETEIQRDATSDGGEIPRVFVPRDTSACALGADRIADAVAEQSQQAGMTFDIVRNGSRGLFWLEPLVEVEIEGQRHGIGPVSEDQVLGLLDALARNTLSDLPNYMGLVSEISELKNQQRLTFARVGEGDPLCLDTYKSLGGFKGLKKALTLSPQGVVDEVKDSGLRGRGGAAFPAGIKWQTVLDSEGDQKYIVCNADEGDSGTFADRLLMEADPYQLIEGMIIAGLAVGATRGYIYLRSEYPNAHCVLNEAVNRAESAGFLGDSLWGTDRCFHLEVRLGAGAYICGEETSLLNSLEGKRGVVRAKPPLPAIEGLFGKPTVVNNVLTLAAVTTILAEGAGFYQDFGMGRSRGTMPFQLAGNIRRGGVVELAFGTTLRQLIEDFGGGSASGRPIKAIQVGGPLGAYLPEFLWDTPMDYEAFASIKAMLGHGGIVVFDDGVDMAHQARFAMEFCAEESCGKCTPCRLGSVRGVEVIDRILASEKRDENLILLQELCDTMEMGSLCAMGGLTPYPVRSALSHFPDDFVSRNVEEGAP